MNANNDAQAAAMQADQQLGSEKNTQSEIDFFANFIQLALLPGNIGLYAIISDMLIKASLTNQDSMKQSLGVKTAANSQLAPHKTTAMANSASKPTQRTNYRANKPAERKLVFKPAILPKSPVEEAVRTKKTVKESRLNAQRIQFRPKTLSPRPKINEAEQTLRDNEGRIIFKKDDNKKRIKYHTDNAANNDSVPSIYQTPKPRYSNGMTF